MAVKKSNVFSVNFTDKAILALQLMGYINKCKKTTGRKNLSKFLSELTVQHIDLHHSLDRRYIEEKALKMELLFLQKHRDKIEGQMTGLAQKLNNLMSINKEVEDGKKRGDGKDKGGEGQQS